MLHSSLFASLIKQRNYFLSSNAPPILLSILTYTGKKQYTNAII